MTGMSSRTGVLVGIWSGCSKNYSGPIIMAFLSSDGAARVAAITERWWGRYAWPAPPSLHTRAIHLRYAHKANRTRNGRPTFPLLFNLFISLLILNLNFNVCVKFALR
ncbi:hypothetical protein ACJJTC_016192 [Scirpophaga incertulas]